jgi:hypothetical protein
LEEEGNYKKLAEDAETELKSLKEKLKLQEVQNDSNEKLKELGIDPKYNSAVLATIGDKIEYDKETGLATNIQDLVTSIKDTHTAFFDQTPTPRGDGGFNSSKSPDGYMSKDRALQLLNSENAADYLNNKEAVDKALAE